MKKNNPKLDVHPTIVSYLNVIGGIITQTIDGYAIYVDGFRIATLSAKQLQDPQTKARLIMAMEDQKCSEMS